MLLFVILALMAIIILVISVIMLSTFGAGFVVVFSDVIVCIAIIVWIMKKLIS